jgi:hypothetical protein
VVLADGTSGKNTKREKKKGEIVKKERRGHQKKKNAVIRVK